MWAKLLNIFLLNISYRNRHISVSTFYLNEIHVKRNGAVIISVIEALT